MAIFSDRQEASTEFLYIGQQRNELVHNNFAEFPLEITSEDIRKKYPSALQIIPIISTALADFEEQ